jgi:hypothetical protein
MQANLSVIADGDRDRYQLPESIAGVSKLLTDNMDGRKSNQKQSLNCRVQNVFSRFSFQSRSA